MHVENKRLLEWKKDMAAHVNSLGLKIEEIHAARSSFKFDRERPSLPIEE